MPNQLYYGDNLQILAKLASETVDLTYLDPPFNSKRNYFVVFRDRTGKPSEAQEEAFFDTWTWTEDTELSFRMFLRTCPNADLTKALKALHDLLSSSPMMAYIFAMASRLAELHRVLKPTGSLYLHCDPTASHYLRLVLDVIFGPVNFRNEIAWKRTNAHNDPKRFGRIHDVILCYAKDARRCFFRPVYVDYRSEYIEAEFRQDTEGRWYKCEDLTAPYHGGTGGKFEFRGRAPGMSRMWRLQAEEMERLYQEGRIKTDKHGVPLLRGHIIYLDEKKGMPVQDWWDDILRVGNTSGERLGYPTQKPVALLERIIESSSNPGDLVLDPFCGCGTTVEAAHKLGRHWMGIDITTVAIGVIKARMESAFPELRDKITIIGLPRDLEGAKTLFEADAHVFQQWACLLISAYPLLKKGADKGIDGWLKFFDFDEVYCECPVQVKGGKITSAQVRDFCHVVTREGSPLGIFLCMSEITKPMKDEALQMGFWDSASGKSYQRVQVISISDILSGRDEPKYPPQDKNSILGYKAKRQQKQGAQVTFEAFDIEPIERRPSRNR